MRLSTVRKIDCEVIRVYLDYSSSVGFDIRLKKPLSVAIAVPSCPPELAWSLEVVHIGQRLTGREVGPSEDSHVLETGAPLRAQLPCRSAPLQVVVALGECQAKLFRRNVHCAYPVSVRLGSRAQASHACDR